MAEQYGFYYDAERCIQCHACELACKSIHGLEPGIHWRKVIEFWTGEFPAVTRTFISLSCLHCAEPACEKACLPGAITKRAEDGIVVVDKEKCNGCGDCYTACPYGVPQFGTDGIMQKCDFCLERGKEPACTEPCPANALSYGTIEELAKLASEKGAEKLAGDTVPSLFIRNRRKAPFTAENLRVG